jgi:hypothetical protein
MRQALAVILLLVVGSAQASTVTIDFEDVVAPQFLPYTSNGYQFSNAGGVDFSSIEYTDFFNRPISNHLVWCGNCTGGVEIALERPDGNPFELLSFFMGVVGAGDSFVELTRENGSTETLVFAYTGPDGNYLSAPEGGWGLVTRAVFSVSSDGSSFGGGLDDLVVSAVPIPAAVWLFGSGLGLLGWFRRRKTV